MTSSSLKPSASSLPGLSFCVALVGNPNTGKSTLFSALAGVRQRIGNYPGVTVEKKIGHATIDGHAFEFVDLPGTYSLAPRSPDEMVAVDVLLGRRSDVRPIQCVLSIVDASNLERNLYLLSQVLALGLPTVVALNMIDVAAGRGMAIDVPALAARLGVPVVPVQANRRQGLAELRAALLATAAAAPGVHCDPFPPAFQQEVNRLHGLIDQPAGDDGAKVHPDPADSSATSAAVPAASPAIPRYLVERLLLDTAGYLEGHLLNGHRERMQAEVRGARDRLAAAGCPVPAVEAMARYEWVGRILEGVVTRPSVHPVTTSDRIDRVLTHRAAGTALFVLLMLLVFTAVFVAAAPAMDLIIAGVDAVGDTVEQNMAPGAARSLLVDGVIGGVGSVLVFLPQILILFFFIGVLEDCGYMARAAYLMDRLMTRVGLSGKSFIPLLSSFACAVPGIMATRVIENRRDRITTILVAPLMSCSARLPVYTILIAAFVPQRAWLYGLVRLQGLTLLSMYLVGMVTAAIVALVLKRSLLRGAPPPFVLELPSYKWPDPRNVVLRMVERAWGFVYRAGTLILAVAIVVWAASYYPHDAATVEGPFQARRAAAEARLAAVPKGDDAGRAQAEEELTDVENDLAAAYQRQSILGRLGQVIEPAVRPLGWDWRIGSAVIASFPAREVVVGVLGVIYNLGTKLDPSQDSDQGRLVDRIRAATWDGTERPVYNIPVALSIMVFFALCAQCSSTLVTIRRETNSWGWPAFTFVYMTTLAYIGAFLTYQVGQLILGG